MEEKGENMRQAASEKFDFVYKFIVIITFSYNERKND